MITEIDAVLREAILFEALKEYEAERATSITDDLIAALIALLVKRGITSFVNVKATTIRALIVDMNKALNEIFDKGDAVLRARLLDVLALTIDSKTRITRLFIDKPAPDKFAAADKSPLLAEVYKEDIPGVGASMLLLFKEFRRAVLQQMQMLVKKAYAENAKIDELMKTLKGTPERKFKDGALNKLANNMRSYMHTAMQQISSFVSYNYDRLFYDRYQWISTIDSRTTDVCRSRHKQIYEYGRGPRPPAHIRCRSRIVGISGDLSNQIPPSYYGWMREQPPGFLSAVLTPAQADAIARGTARASDFAQFANVRKLTPSQYKRAVDAHIIEPGRNNENA